MCSLSEGKLTFARERKYILSRGGPLSNKCVVFGFSGCVVALGDECITFPFSSVQANGNWRPQQFSSSSYTSPGKGSPRVRSFRFLILAVSLSPWMQPRTFTHLKSSQLQSVRRGYPCPYLACLLLLFCSSRLLPPLLTV